MRKSSVFLAASTALLLFGSGFASAQVTSSASMTVTANNQGVFTLTLGAASFDFGNVDANGTLSSTGVAGVRNASGATYTKTAATTWTCAAAPGKTVAIKLNSISTDHTVGSMAHDDLQVQLPVATTGGGATTGFQAFTSGANLLTGVTAGNGASRATGNVDLQLNVLDTDATGANSWTVKLTATGT